MIEQLDYTDRKIIGAIVDSAIGYIINKENTAIIKNYIVVELIDSKTDVEIDYDLGLFSMLYHRDKQKAENYLGHLLKTKVLETIVSVLFD